METVAHNPLRPIHQHLTLQGRHQSSADSRDDITEQPFLDSVFGEPVQNGQESLQYTKGSLFGATVEKQENKRSASVLTVTSCKSQSHETNSAAFS